METSPNFLWDKYNTIFQDLNTILIHVCFQDAKEYGAIDCRIWETGMVALTGNFKFIAVTDLNEPRPKAMYDPGKLMEITF